MTASRTRSTTRNRKAKATGPRRAVIYVRISKDRDGQHSTDSQERACRAFAESQGWSVVAVETDQGKSAYSGKHRPAFERALGLIDNGIADTLLVWAVDRAARSTIDLDRMLDRLDQAGAGFASATQGVMNTTESMGVALLKIIGVLAELESAMKSERMLEHHEERRLAGRPTAGPRTFGFQRDGSGGLEQDGVEADHVRDIFDWYLAGESMNAIACRLNAAGVQSSTGKRFYSQTVRDLLGNPAVAGLFRIDDVLVEGDWEAIVSRETWEAVQDLRASSIVRRPNYRRHLLSGLLVCGRCGANMRGGLHISGSNRYTCSGASCFNGMIAAQLEQFVVGVVLGNISRDRWNDMRSAAAGVNPAHALRAELEQLATDYGKGLVTAPEWQALRPGLLARIEQAEASGIVRSALPDVDDLGASWEQLSEEQQRTVLAAIVDRVALGPSTKPGRIDYSRIVITERV